MKKFLSMFLAIVMLLSVAVLPVSATEAGGNWNGGTLVSYDAEDPDGDGIKDNTEAYTVTVPAQLAPGTGGEVVLAGTWASDRMVVVTADEEVVLENSINSNNTKTLAVTFKTIEQEGSNTSTIEVKEDVSVAGISNAIFGTWSGTFNYFVDIVDSQTTGGCDTLYWDGNTDGLECYGNGYKISTATPTISEFVSGGTMVAVNEGTEMVFQITDTNIQSFNGIFIVSVDGAGLVVIFPSDYVADGITFSSGLYFAKYSSDTYVKSLTINGYTGFEHSEHCGHNSSDGDSTILAGLYQTGAIALYEAEGEDAIADMLITPWDELIADGTIKVKNGAVYTIDTTENGPEDIMGGLLKGDYYVNAVADKLAGDLILPNDGMITAIGDLNIIYDDNNNPITEGSTLGFVGCNQLTGIKVPDTIKIFGCAALSQCTSLTRVNVPHGTEVIGYFAFSATNLTSCHIPETVAYISFAPFVMSNNMQAIDVEDIGAFCGVRAMMADIGAIFTTGWDDNGVIACELWQNGVPVKDLVIPDGVTKINKNVFLCAKGIESVTIPDSVTFIGDYAFGGLEATQITIGKNVTHIGEDAFSQNNVSSIVLPKTLEYIGLDAFYSNDNLTSVIFEGTADEWNNVTRESYGGSSWYKYIPATQIYCQADDVYIPIS